MLLSMALLLLCGLTLYKVCALLRIPGVIGLLLTGMVLGPYALNLLDPSLLAISGDLRQLALVIILIRAGLSLDIEDLKKVGRPALLLSCTPALFEVGGILLLGPPLLGISLEQALLLGTIVAAVSPAIIVPRMLQLMQDGYGKKRRIPQMILAGATVDDIFVIVLFTVALQAVVEGSFSYQALVGIPFSLIVGLLIGAVVGIVLYKLFRFFHMRDTIKVVIVLSFSIILLALESYVTPLPYSGLIAIMTLGGALLQQEKGLATRLSAKFEKLWLVAQITLFVLIGAEVQFAYALEAGIPVLILILGALCFRMLGVFIALWKSDLSLEERIFCLFSYMPKATVQAAIGAIPLSLAVPGGELFLTAAVVAILVTAPLGAVLMDLSYKKLLKDDR